MKDVLQDAIGAFVERRVRVDFGGLDRRAAVGSFTVRQFTLDFLRRRFFGGGGGIVTLARFERRLQFLQNRLPLIGTDFFAVATAFSAFRLLRGLGRDRVGQLGRLLGQDFPARVRQVTRNELVRRRPRRRELAGQREASGMVPSRHAKPLGGVGVRPDPQLALRDLCSIAMKRQ